MLEEKRITIFTPTYNRESTLPRLYQSLCRQTVSDFYWLLINDGSIDNTETLVKGWQLEEKIQIVYFYQENSGKANAHNAAVKYADTELFLCVDSDDYLVDNAVKRILEYWEENKNSTGILALKGDRSGQPITKWESTVKYATLLEATRIYGLRGDTMLVFRTEILKKYFFPVFPGERFVPESYLYDQIDLEGKLHILPEVLYLCEYRPDGYTANIRKVNCNNPNGYLAYIQQRLKLDKEIKYKIADTIRYIGIKCVQKDGRLLKDTIYPKLTILFLGIGWLFYIKVYWRFTRKW